MTEDIPNSDKAKHLIDLFKHGDVLIHNWLKALITIQSALAVAFIFLFKDLAGSRPLPNWFTIVLALLIPGLGALFALVVSDAVSREFYWQAWFRDSCNMLCKWDQAVFPFVKKRARATE